MPNRVRFDGRARRFYEVWYAIFNEPASGDGFWIRYTLRNPLDSGGALWFAHTSRRDRHRHLALVREHSPREIDAVAGATAIRIGDGELAEGRLRGEIRDDAHRVSWDLAYDPCPEAHDYFRPPLRTLAELRSSVTIPNPRTSFRGVVRIDDEEHAIGGAIGHQAHHWGTAQAERWDWAHCCDFEDDPSAVLELLSAPTPLGATATFANFYSDELTARFDGLGSLLSNRARSGLGFWQFEASDGGLRLLVDLRVDPADVQRFTYHSTTGRSSECWNTQVADCLVRIYRRSGRGGEELSRVLRSRARAAAEVHESDLDRIPYRAWRGDAS